MTVLEIVEDEILAALERGVGLPDYLTIRLEDFTPVALFHNAEETLEVAGIRVRVCLEGVADIHNTQFFETEH